MQRITFTGLTFLALTAGFAHAEAEPAYRAHPLFAEAPDGFVPPPLHPGGAELQTKQLSRGVYALISTKPPVDNAGFIVGDDGVLVIDSHINGEMAGQIIERVREVTDKPILYLVNTNYHGDHTFGNSAFPETATIIAHRETAAHMKNFELERGLMLVTVGGDASVLSDVTPRLPDVTFEDSLVIDLGNQIVELFNFGHGNTAGDTIVYAPEAGAIWTGNLITGLDSIPPMFEVGADVYLQTVTRLATKLDARTVIPGHGIPVIGDGQALISRNVDYLSDLLAAVRASIEAGQSVDNAVDALALKARFLPAPGAPTEVMTPLLIGFHRNNIAVTYRGLTENRVASK